MTPFAYRVVVRWSEPDGAYVAEVPAVPGAGGDAPTAAEAVRLAQESALELLDLKKEFGDPMPTPDAAEVEYSGQLRIRLPKSLHKGLASAANREGVSLNQLMVAFLAEQLGRSARSDMSTHFVADTTGAASRWAEAVNIYLHITRATFASCLANVVRGDAPSAVTGQTIDLIKEGRPCLNLN